jgi:EmrB/QacA subfamily drug resistance transporter
MPPPRSSAFTAGQVDPATRNLVVGIICTGSFLSPLSMSAVNVAIPQMANSLQASAESVALVPTLFLLGSVALMLPFARLADNLGRKRIYVGGLMVNAGASLACWAAGSIEWILPLRFLQGAGSAMAFGTSLAIITSVFPPERRGLPLGLNTAAVYTGLTVAPALGGLVTDLLSWREVFLLPVPPMLLLALVMSRIGLEWRNEHRARFDWQGALLFAGWACALVYGLKGLPATPNVIALMLSLALMLLFIYHQSRRAEPLIRVQLLVRNRLFGRSLGTSSLMYGAMYPLVFLLSLYLQYLRGFSALHAGQVMLVQTVAMALVAPFAGRLSDRVEPRIIATVGCLLCVAGFLLLTRLGYETSSVYIGATLFLLGFGFALFSSPNNNAVMGAVEPGDLGMASATVNLARVSGNLLGISLVNLLVHLALGDARITPDQYDRLLALITGALSGSALVALLAAALSASRGRMRAPATA